MSIWSNLAATSEYPVLAKAAVERREELELLLTPVEIAEAQRRASNWSPQPKQIDEPAPLQLPIFAANIERGLNAAQA